MRDQSATLLVAAAQMTVTEQISDNLERIIQTMERCAADGAELLLFPETALSGYSPAIGHGREVAEWQTLRRSLESISRFSRELGLWVVVGTEAWTGKAWVNRLYAYSEKGQVVATYDKVHLMYPSLTVRVVEEPTTLREFIATLGKDTLYAYDRRVVGVLVNNRRLWDSARLKPGDKVVVFPIIVGG